MEDKHICLIVTHLLSCKRCFSWLLPWRLSRRLCLDPLQCQWTLDSSWTLDCRRACLQISHRAEEGSRRGSLWRGKGKNRGVTENLKLWRVPFGWKRRGASRAALLLLKRHAFTFRPTWGTGKVKISLMGWTAQIDGAAACGTHMGCGTLDAVSWSEPARSVWTLGSGLTCLVWTLYHCNYYLS